MEPVAGVGDVTCSLLLPVSVLWQQKVLELSFVFLTKIRFFRSFHASIYGPHAPQEFKIGALHVGSCFCNFFHTQ